MNAKRSSLSGYQAPNPHLWKGRESGHISAQYWHEAVVCVEEKEWEGKGCEPGIALLGYAVDEGVRRNLGRVGAAQGPNALRQVMAGMAYHVHPKQRIWDLGNLMCLDGHLEETQAVMAQAVTTLLKGKHFPVLMGGGHDLAWPHIQGIMQHLHVAHPEASLGVINLDAHFDLRSYASGGHSGSPFLQALEQYGSQMGYLCLGIQQAANPQTLFETAQKHQVQWVEASQTHVLHWQSLKQTLETFIARHDYLYLSIDLDAFSSAYAPGVSAPSPMGIATDVGLAILEHIALSKKLLSMDVVELNPNYDVDHSTARLAARCIAHVLRHRP
jgi:formiminoglutamase